LPDLKAAKFGTARLAREWLARKKLPAVIQPQDFWFVNYRRPFEPPNVRGGDYLTGSPSSRRDSHAATARSPFNRSQIPGFAINYRRKIVPKIDFANIAIVTV
jgi:hypothetical protein